jgi:hypothetical protein
VAVGFGHTAFGVAVQIGIEDDVDRIHEDSNGGVAGEGVTEEELLLDLHFPLDGVCLYFVVEDVVADCFIAEVELYTAGFAAFLRLDYDLAALH